MLLVALLFACGGGDDGGADADADSDSGAPTAGLYAVTHHTESALLDVDCTVEGNERTDPAYFQVVESSSASGDPVFGFHPCAANDESTCEALESLGFVDTRGAGGWTSSLPYSRETGTECALSLVTDVLLSGAAGSLRLEARAYGETIPVSDGPCTADEAAARGTDMPCERYEVIEGSPAF